MRRARPFHQMITRFRRGSVVAGACALVVLTPLAGMSAAHADPPPPAVAAAVDLGSAAGFSVLAGPSIANTGAGTVLALDLGVTGTVAGFPPGTVNGTQHLGNEAAAAHDDRQAAYDSVVAQTGGTAFGGDLAGTTFTPGLYSSVAAVTNTGTITLDAAGDPSALFVFQVGAALSSAAATKIVLAHGALANNVYWQVVGAVSLGANVKWAGTLLGAGAVAFGDGASLKGRLLTPGTVALANSPITKPIDDLVAPVVTINGGSTRSTRDTTPSISGTTDEPGTPLVTVRIGSQVLSTRAADGAWALSTDALSVGPHTTVASVTDPSGNTGTATQELTVDTAAPEVGITGGATTATHDSTPTITGTTDEAGSPTVTVTVGGQTLTTTAGVDGTWSVEPTTLTETSHNVQAAVTDAAGNTGTQSQVLTVDYTVPVLTIDGGATRSTSDTSPWTYGTTAEQAGTIVHVSVGGQTLTATVQPSGSWGVSAQTLPSGTYTVLASITDAAQNTGTMTQRLQVGSTVSNPVIPPSTPPPSTPPPSTPPPSTTPPSTTPPSTTPPAATYRPDAEIRQAGHAFTGKGRYGAARQRVATRVRGARARTTTYVVRTTNRGNSADQVIVRGTARSPMFAVTYLSGRRNVTSAVLRGTYRSPVLRPGASVSLTVRVTKVNRARDGTGRTFAIRSTSTHNHAKADTVRAALRAVR